MPTFCFPWPRTPHTPEWEAQFQISLARKLTREHTVFLIGTALFQLFNLLYTLFYTGFRLHTPASRVYFSLYLALLLIVLGSLLALWLEVRRDRFDRILRLQNLYVTCALLWSICVTVYDQRVSDQIYTYLLILLAISVLAYLPPRISLPLFLGGQLLFMTALPLFQPDGRDNYGALVNSAAFCLIALFISVSRYFGARRSAEDQQIIQEKNRELDNVANRDPLTGLWNRRYLDHFLDELIRSGQGPNGVGVFILDVDNFKQYNDSYGHVMGDACLKRIAAALESCCDSGRVFRFGGEEFLYVAPTGQLEPLHQLAEQVRQTVEALQIPAGPEGRVVTISVGCSLAPICRTEDWDRLLRAADQALYQAKSAGKNRVAPPLCPGLPSKTEQTKRPARDL